MANALMDKFVLAVYSCGDHGAKPVSESTLLEHDFSKAALFSASESAQDKKLVTPHNHMNMTLVFTLTSKGRRYAEVLLDEKDVE